VIRNDKPARVDIDLCGTADDWDRRGVVAGAGDSLVGSIAGRYSDRAGKRPILFSAHNMCTAEFAAVGDCLAGATPVTVKFPCIHWF